MAGVLVQFSSASGAFIPAMTNASGQAKVLVPANEDLILSVGNECGTTVFTIRIVALSNNTDLGILPVSGNASVFTFKGKLVDCAGHPVKNGVAYFVVDCYMHWIAQTNTDGDFSYTWISCQGAGTTINVFGTDETTQEKSVGTDFKINTQLMDFGTIPVCVSSAQQFIRYKLD